MLAFYKIFHMSGYGELSTHTKKVEEWSQGLKNRFKKLTVNTLFEETKDEPVVAKKILNNQQKQQVNSQIDKSLNVKADNFVPQNNSQANRGGKNNRGGNRGGGRLVHRDDSAEYALLSQLKPRNDAPLPGNRGGRGAQRGRGAGQQRGAGYGNNSARTERASSSSSITSVLKKHRQEATVEYFESKNAANLQKKFPNFRSFYEDKMVNSMQEGSKNSPTSPIVYRSQFNK